MALDFTKPVHRWSTSVIENFSIHNYRARDVRLSWWKRKIPTMKKKPTRLIPAIRKVSQSEFWGPRENFFPRRDSWKGRLTNTICRKGKTLLVRAIHRMQIPCRFSQVALIRVPSRNQNRLYYSYDVPRTRICTLRSAHTAYRGCNWTRLFINESFHSHREKFPQGWDRL